MTPFCCALEQTPQILFQFLHIFSQEDAALSSLVTRSICGPDLNLWKQSPAPSAQHLSKAWLGETIFFNDYLKNVFFSRSVIINLFSEKPNSEKKVTCYQFFLKEVIFFIRNVVSTTLLKCAFIVSPITKGLHSFG